MSAAAFYSPSCSHNKTRLQKVNQEQLVEAYECVIVQLIRPSLILTEMTDFFESMLFKYYLYR